MDIPMQDDNSNDSYRYKNYQNRRRQSDHQQFRNDSRQRPYHGPPPGNDGQRGFPFQMGQQGPSYPDPCFREGMQQQNFQHFGNPPPVPPMFHPQGFQMQNFPHSPRFPGPQNQMGPGPGGYFGMPPRFQGHQPFEQGAQNYQNEQVYNNMTQNEETKIKEGKPQMPPEKLKLLSNLGGYLNYAEYSDTDDENIEKKIKDGNDDTEKTFHETESVEKNKNKIGKRSSAENIKIFNPSVMPPLPPPLPPSLSSPSQFQQIKSPMITPSSYSSRNDSPNGSYTPKLENIPTPPQPYPSPHSVRMPHSSPHPERMSHSSPHPVRMPHVSYPSNTMLNAPLSNPPMNLKANPVHQAFEPNVFNADLPPLPLSSPPKDILKEAVLTSSPLPTKLKISSLSSTEILDEGDSQEDNSVIQSQSSEKQCIEISTNKDNVEQAVDDDHSISEKDKHETSTDRLALDMEKQQIDVVSSTKEDVTSPKKEEKEKAVEKLIITPSKKMNFPMLGKEAAKKILKSFSTNKALLKEKPKLDDGDEKVKLSLLDTVDDDKKDSNLKKKKKNEKVSFIEQIKEEETRIKEVLNHTSNIFSSYGFGLGMPEINNFFDNPEALRKFEARGKDFVQKIEKGELVSKIMLESGGTKEKERSSRSSHHKESSKDKNRDGSSKKRKEDDGRKSSKSAESETPTKHKSKEIPTSWKEMKKRNMKMIDLWRIIDNARRKSKSSSLSKDKSETNKNLPFPDLPKRFQQYKAHEAVNNGMKYYPGSLVQYTNTKPSISYCVDSKKYKSHFWTRRELKIRNRNNPRINEIIEKFWNLEPNVKTKPFPSQQNWWSNNYLEETLNDETDEEEKKEDEEEKEEDEEKKEEEEEEEQEENEEKERNESALDYLSSSYKLSDRIDKSEEDEDLSPEEESLSSIEKVDDERDFELSKSDYLITQETPKNENSTEVKQSTQKLNEEYEAFINTLEYKPDESCSTTGLSEDNLDFNTSFLSFDEIPDSGDTERMLKNKKAKKKPSLPYQPKSIKEIKQLLLDSTKLSKRQRKELKRLKKGMKKEKLEIKRLKKEAKKKRKEEKKMKKKQAKKKEKMEEHIPVVSTRNVSKDIETNKNCLGEDTFVIDEWEEEYNIDAVSDAITRKNVVKNKECSDRSDFHVKNKECSDRSDFHVKNKECSDRSDFHVKNKECSDRSDFHVKNKECSDRSDLHELSKSSFSPVASSSASNFSVCKGIDEDSAIEDQIDRTPDRYSPSNMSVCSPESPEASSPDLCFSFNNMKGASEYPPSPYSPSSPQSSISDLGEANPADSATSLDAIPLPSMQLISLNPNTKCSPGTTFKPLEKEKTSFEPAIKLKPSIDKNICQEPEHEETCKEPVKKTPVVFKLGSKKQSGGLKLLQKTPLPGFAENEEEDERRSPMFDLHEGSIKLDKLKSPLIDNSFPTKDLSVTDRKEKESNADKEIKDSSVESETETGIRKDSKHSYSSKDTRIDSGKEAEKSSKRSHSSSKEDEVTGSGKESSTSKSFSSDSGKSSKRLRESESKRGKDHTVVSSENKNSSTSDKRRDSSRDRRSPSPKRRKERRREGSLESRRKHRSRSPEGSRRSYQKSDHESSSYGSRSRSPPSRSDRSGGSAYNERYRSPEKFEEKDRDSRRDSRSQSPNSKWKRIKSPPPKRYKESSEWSRGQEGRRRYYRDDETSSRSYSPRSRSRSSSRLDSPENIRRIRSPEYDDFKTTSEEKLESYSPRPIHSISNQFPKSDVSEHWDWEDSSKVFYPSGDTHLSGDGKERASSPTKSPKRLSLDERLKQEHGVEVEDQLNQGDYPRQGYYWEYEPPPPVGVGAPQVMRIGNVLQIFPLPDNNASEGSAPPQENHAYVGIPVPPPAVPPTGIPNLGIPPPEMPAVVSKIVQSGNMIEVVPTETLPSTNVDSSKTDLHSESQNVSAVISASVTATSVSSIKTGSDIITPVPPPSTTPSNPLAFISSLLASSMSKPTTLLTSTTAPSIAPVTSTTMFPDTSQDTLTTRVEEMPKPVESCIPGLDTQQQQAIISAAVAAAASGVTASNLPIAHLISVLQQQSLLSQPIVAPPPSEVTSTTRVNESQPQVETQTHPELPSKIDLEAFKREIKERKKQKRKEKEMRREARRQKAILKKLEQQQKLEQKMEEMKEEEDLYDEDDAVLKEAMTEVPELGSPVPEYEVYNDDDLDEDEEEEKKPLQPLPLPPEKGILIGPTYRIIRNKERKTVSFADGVMPGYGTSPSGGEEIHSPPPQIFPEKEKKKKLRKKKKVKVRIIKQYVLGDTRMDSPPPPPETPPTPGTLKLYPGCTHYTLTSPGTFVIYTQQPLKVNGSSLGLAVGNSVTIPPGMLIHSSALSKQYATEGIGSMLPSLPSSFPSLDGVGREDQNVMGNQELVQSPNPN